MNITCTFLNSWTSIFFCYSSSKININNRCSERNFSRSFKLHCHVSTWVHKYSGFSTSTCIDVIDNVAKLLVPKKFGQVVSDYTIKSCWTGSFTTKDKQLSAQLIIMQTWNFMVFSFTFHDGFSFSFNRFAI